MYFSLSIFHSHIDGSSSSIGLIDPSWQALIESQWHLSPSADKKEPLSYLINDCKVVIRHVHFSLSLISSYFTLIITLMMWRTFGKDADVLYARARRLHSCLF